MNKNWLCCKSCILIKKKKLNFGYLANSVSHSKTHIRPTWPKPSSLLCAA